MQAFKWTEPSAAVPALARALRATRTATAELGADPDVARLLTLKERQIADAIHASLGLSFTAIAQPAGTPEATGPFNAGPVAMAAVTPGQTIEVRTVFVNRSPVEVTSVRVNLQAQGDWSIHGDAAQADAKRKPAVAGTFTVTVPDDAPLTRPYFARTSIQEARYAITDPSQIYRPSSEPPLEAVARYEVNGVPVDIRRAVTRLESHLPYGNDTRVLAVVPAAGRHAQPGSGRRALSKSAKTVRLKAEVLHNREGQSSGTLTLKVPPGWKVEPSTYAFQFSHAGERGLYQFTVTIPSLDNRDYRIEAVATSGGREYREGYDTIQHRDLETRYLYRDATATVRGIDLSIAPGLKVGYVMGVGDDVPGGLSQLGVDVRLLGPQELATADLSRLNAIITGTRAYAVREDLKTYNHRLLDYVKNGGNLIVLYNTQEFVPDRYAPYPGNLPGTAEEVSEEDSPVDILAPSDPVLNSPNKITASDFDGWVEQRGSKFWSTWDTAYTPMIATWDKGQPPQKGGWLHATYGKGHYTYFAYALHRQLPSGVPGAYRLLANLLSQGRAH